MPDLEALRDGLPVVAFILVAGYVGYVAAIIVPFLRRAAEPPGDGSQFTWNFIVPCLDEAATAGNSVRRLLVQFPGADVWCVDDASTDATPLILNRLAAEFERLHVVTRRLPNAREGKGLALNAGWEAMSMALPLGVDPRRIIVGVIDADGHLDPRCLDVIAGAACFGDPSVSAVQIKVRVATDRIGPSSQRPSRFGRLLVRLQDSEFTGIIAAQQILRRRLGSVGLGGNGQFARLTALNRIAETYGAPWHRSLLEDFELGLRVLLTGGRTQYCHETWVQQEGLIDVGALVRQRSRWAQGGMQCMRYLLPVVRARQISNLGALEIAYFLFVPWIQLLATLLFAAAGAAVIYYALSLPGASLDWLGAGGWWPVAFFVVCGLAPLVIWGPIYRRTAGPGMSRAGSVTFGLAHWPYTLVNVVAVWSAFIRVLRSRDDWTKTERVARYAPQAARHERQGSTSGALGRRTNGAAERAGPRVLVIVGTRPEAIKLAPVISAIRRRPNMSCLVCGTGQHTGMLRRALASFELEVDVDLAVMKPGQGLAGLTSRLFVLIDQLIDDCRPEWLVVQGDTTSAYVAAMAAFYRGVPVAHVEAGLRTGDPRSPFPEEVNRRAISMIADLHFAPTRGAAANLRREGVLSSKLVVTGNTTVDALVWARRRVTASMPPSLPAGLSLRLGDRRLVLVTSHRRESFGEGLRGICEAVRDLGDRFDDVVIAYPMHRNPAVRRQVGALLDGRASVVLLDDVDYLAMLWLMDRSSLVITDSGGLQEEAPSLGKPLLVVREQTERPEAVEAGCAFVVGTDRQAIVAGASRLLLSSKAYEAACPRSNPFGDGAAAARIVDVLSAQPGLGTPRRTAAEDLVRAHADRVPARRRVPDPLDRVRTETSTRMAQLRPLVDEHTRLKAAVQALGDADSRTSAPPAGDTA